MNLKKTIQSILILALFFISSGVIAQDTQIPAFVYHRFGESKYPSTNIETDVFENQLLYLQKNNYKSLTASEAIFLLNSKEIKIEKYVLITVDDAFKSFYTIAFPLLIKHDIKTTLFVNTETIGQGGYMSWDELKKVKEAGIEIANHSHSHSFFLNKPDYPAYFKADLNTAKQLLKSKLEVDGNIFAFPYGEYDDKMIEIVKHAGFKYAFSQHSGVINAQANPMLLPRFPMGGSYATYNGFVEKLQMKGMNVKSDLTNTLYSENPPKLTIQVMQNDIDFDRLQGFVNGKKTNVELDANNKLILKPDWKLNSRRTIYTITAPAKNGKGWYWYSHLYIRPEQL